MIELCHLITAVSVGIIIVSVGKMIGLWLADR
jgi:hypothetical protein